MKKTLAILFIVLFAAFSACAQGESITACGLTAARDAKAIDFGSRNVTDIDELVRMLDQMPALEKVDMYGASLEKEEMDMLFHRYPQITFGWTYYVGDHKVRTDMTAFSTLHGSDPEPSHSERNFKWLKFCKGLKAIDVGHNAVGDITWLADFPELKVLILAVNWVEDISVLSQLQELEYLELFTNQVTDLAPLAELAQLKDLNIKNNPVKDVSVLFGMQQLERLWLGRGYMKHVPQAQREELARALPQCEIDWESSPTGGTWRTHPRYDVIHEMFNTFTYIPFE